jgi:Tol biopolymer transport system component
MLTSMSAALPAPETRLKRTLVVICCTALAIVLQVYMATPLIAQRLATVDRIAFTRVREDLTRQGDYRLEAEIWVMNSDGSDPRRLTTNTSDDYGVAWSPDGSSLLFGAVQFEADSAGELKARTAHIYSMSADGGEATLISPRDLRAQFPNWSNDGRSVVFHGARGFGNASSLEIYLMNADGTDVRQLTSNSWADARPDLSPDGKRVVFQSNRGGSTQIHIMNADGSADVPVTSGAGVNNQSPDWSPDGTRIIFVSNRDGNAEIYVMNADGTGQQRLTNSDAPEADPEWSSDGKQIVFDRDVVFEGKEVPQLYIMNADGSNQRALTTLPSSSSHAAWSRRRP